VVTERDRLPPDLAEISRDLRREMTIMERIHRVLASYDAARAGRKQSTRKGAV